MFALMVELECNALIFGIYPIDEIIEKLVVVNRELAKRKAVLTKLPHRAARELAAVGANFTHPRKLANNWLDFEFRTPGR